MYTAKELESHYVLCGHRMLGEESRRVFGMISGKYERNPTIKPAEKEKRLQCLQRRRDWETRRLYPDVGQPLVDGYLESCDEVGLDSQR